MRGIFVTPSSLVQVVTVQSRKGEIGKWCRGSWWQWESEGSQGYRGWNFSTYTQTCIHGCSVSLLPMRICACVRLCVVRIVTQVYRRVRCTVIQRTGAQDKRRKSLILNGARTDITRELEIDGGRKRRGGSERARYIVKSGAAEEIYRDPMSRIERSTGLSCSTILAERERERSHRIDLETSVCLFEFPGPCEGQERIFRMLNRKGG